MLHVDAPTVGLIGRIPVRNIWLLLLYASRLYRELPEANRVELEDAPDDIPELVAEILANAVERRLRRNLGFGYERREADLSRVRGRINVLRTERRQLLQRGKVACIFDELTVDTPRNRYVKAALLRLGQVVKDTELLRRCRNLSARLERAGVSSDGDAGRNGRHPPPDVLGWMESDERRMLAAAQLAFDLAIPTEQSGHALLAMADREANRGWKLYEDAMFGFYDEVLSHQDWRVRRQGKIDWPVVNPTDDFASLMPSMYTDIVLEYRQPNFPTDARRVVIDTKFTSMVTPGSRGGETFRSANIYQIYAYLRSQERANDPLSLTSTGVLLYPSLGTGYHEKATIQGHEIRFATVNLAADTQTIRCQLLRAVDAAPAPAGAGCQGP